jgi:succinyl-CoA synthetase beta subunit
VATQDVTAMIDGLRLNRLLSGFRGRPPADRKALEATVRALAQLYLDHRARIEDIEINPLMVRPSGAVAVDVRVIWRTGDA